MSYEVLGEDEHAFSVRHKSGQQFTIAKQAIGQALMDKIRQMKPQKLNEGGEVAPPALQEMPGQQDETLAPMLNQSFTPSPDEVFQQKVNSEIDRRMIDPAALDRNPDVRAELEKSVLRNMNQEKSSANAAASGDIAKKQASMEEMNKLRTEAGLSPLPPESNLIASNNGIPANALRGVPIGGEATPQGNGQEGSAYAANPKTGMIPQMMQLQQEGIGAIQSQAKAQQGLAADQTKILQQQELDQKQAYNDYVARIGRLDRESQQISDSIMNQKIDPNRVWHESSTGGKIAASIGMILGGLGAGLTGGPNQGVAMVNKIIDRDIDAQKTELGKKQTLFSQNMARLHNEQAAYAATKMQMSSIYQGQLQAAAAKAQGPMAAAQAAQMTVALKKEMLPMQMQYARFEQSVASGNGGMQISTVVPEHQQPEAMKELKFMQSLGSSVHNLNDAFDKVNELNTVGARVLRAGFEPEKVKALRDPLVAQLSKDSAGKFTEQDAEALSAFFPKPGDADSTVKLKKQKMNEFLREKMHSPLLDAYGIRYKTGAIQKLRPGDFNK